MLRESSASRAMKGQQAVLDVDAGGSFFDGIPFFRETTRRTLRHFEAPKKTHARVPLCRKRLSSEGTSFCYFSLGQQRLDSA